MQLWSSKTKRFCETSFKNDMWSRHCASEFPYGLARLKWVFHKYCACHEKVEPRHTNSCNCHAKWFLQGNRHEFATLPRIPRPKLQTSISQSPKPEIPALPRENHRFEPFPHPPRVPTFASLTNFCATYFATCRIHCACHAKRILNFQKRPQTVTVFNDFDFQIAFAPQHFANFPAAQDVDKICTTLWRESDLAVKIVKAPWSTFGSWAFKICTTLWHESDSEGEIVQTPWVLSAFGSWASHYLQYAVARERFGSRNR